jgi:hypothetical protein
MRKIDEKAETPKGKEDVVASPYDPYNKKELEEFLTKNGVQLKGKENKQELIALIKENGLNITPNDAPKTGNDT